MADNNFNPQEKYGIRVQHVGIHVRNFERTFKWYHELFGFELVEKKGGGQFKGGVFPKMTWIHMGDFFLEIYEVQDAEPFSLVDFEWTIGVKHLNFEIADLKGWLDYIRTRDDVPIVVENQYSETAGAVYILDPDGILVEVTSA